jgi:hypothetical protein
MIRRHNIIGASDSKESRLELIGVRLELFGNLRKQLITIALCDISTGNPVVPYESVVQNAVCVTFHPPSYGSDPFFIFRWE